MLQYIYLTINMIYWDVEVSHCLTGMKITNKDTVSTSFGNHISYKLCSYRFPALRLKKRGKGASISTKNGKETYFLSRPAMSFDLMDARMLESKGITESVMSSSIDFNSSCLWILKSIHKQNGLNIIFQSCQVLQIFLFYSSHPRPLDEIQPPQSIPVIGNLLNRCR